MSEGDHVLIHGVGLTLGVIRGDVMTVVEDQEVVQALEEIAEITGKRETTCLILLQLLTVVYSSF